MRSSDPPWVTHTPLGVEQILLLLIFSSTNGLIATLHAPFEGARSSRSKSYHDQTPCLYFQFCFKSVPILFHHSVCHAAEIKLDTVSVSNWTPWSPWSIAPSLLKQKRSRLCCSESCAGERMQRREFLESGEKGLCLG